jgi:hypothetical protein
MSISYPNSVTVINNITSSGGNGNATSIGGYPITTSSLNQYDFLAFETNNQEWINIPYQTSYFFPILATPTNASGTGQQELTRFSFQLPPGTQEEFKFSYSLDANETGSIAVSSSVDGIIGQVQVSGTTTVSPTSFNANISGSQPYYLVASSSNTSSGFKIYNAVMIFQA